MPQIIMYNYASWYNHKRIESKNPKDRQNESYEAEAERVEQLEGDDLLDYLTKWE